MGADFAYSTTRVQCTRSLSYSDFLSLRRCPWLTVRFPRSATGRRMDLLNADSASPPLHFNKGKHFWPDLDPEFSIRTHLRNHFGYVTTSASSARVSSTAPYKRSSLFRLLYVAFTFTALQASAQLNPTHPARTVDHRPTSVLPSPCVPSRPSHTFTR